MMRPVPLPEPGDQDAVDHDVGVVERVEGEARPAEALDDMLDAQVGIEDPLPDQPVTMKLSANG